jgi:SAM-dependent methyltransferase
MNSEFRIQNEELRMASLRRLFRLLFPRRTHPVLDAVLAPSDRDVSNDARYRALVGDADAFIASRYAEGMRWRYVLSQYVGSPARVLDVGAGNGAIELAVAAGGYRVVSIDALWNEQARKLGVMRVVADASRLPFCDGVFDAALSLETIEHLPDVRESCRELSRTLRGGAVVLLTTPPRWRYAFTRDPHFGVRFLTLMPTAFQRRVAQRRYEYVDRIYGSTAAIARAMRPLRIVEVLSRSRMPKRWFWDALVFRLERSRAAALPPHS